MLPIRNGHVLRPLPKATLQRLGRIPNAVFVDVDGELEETSWEMMSSQASDAGSDVSATLLESSPKKNNGAVVALMVAADKPEDECFDCVECGQLIGPDTCMISWQVTESGLIYELHSSCCATFAVCQGISYEMMTALVEHQEFAPPRVHGVMNLIVHEILDMTKVKSHDCAPPPSKSLKTTLAVLCEEDSQGAFPFPAEAATIPGILGDESDEFPETFPDTVQEPVEDSQAQD